MARFIVECIHCGARNSIRFSNCVSCGKKLPDYLKHIALPGKIDEDLSDVNDRSRPGKLKRFLITLWFLLILFGFGFGVVKVGQYNQKRSTFYIPLLLKNEYVSYKASDDVINDNNKVQLWSRSLVTAFLVATVVFVIIIIKLLLMYRSSKVRGQNLQELAVTDELTKLYSHRYLMVKLEEQLKLCKKKKQALSFAILDIDHFKKFNDTYGHEVGNLVLQMFGAVMKDTFRVDSSSRQSDILARYGGEEFCVIFIGIKAQGAYIATERFRRALAKTVIPTLQDVIVTVSAGIAELDVAKGIDNVKTLIESADQALYQAKENGRNQVIIFS